MIFSLERKVSSLREFRITKKSGRITCKMEIFYSVNYWPFIVKNLDWALKSENLVFKF